MKHHSTIAGIVAFTLVMQTALVAHAEETSEAAEDVVAEVAPVETAPAEERTPVTFSFLKRPNEVDVAARLALANASIRGSSLLAPTPSPIMSSNTKTVLIVAIIAGAVLIAVGAIAIGKPFKHL